MCSKRSKNRNDMRTKFKGNQIFICPACKTVFNLAIVPKQELVQEDIPMSTTRFKKPTAKEVAQYAREKGYELDAKYFCSYYESVGWKVGKKPMKSWKGAVHTFIRNQLNWGGKGAVRKIRNPSQVRVNVGFQTEQLGSSQEGV